MRRQLNWKVGLALLFVGLILGQVGTAHAWWQSDPGTTCATTPVTDATYGRGYVISRYLNTTNAYCPVHEDADHARVTSVGAVVRFYDGSVASQFSVSVSIRDPYSASIESISGPVTDGSSGGQGYVSYNPPLPSNWGNWAYVMWLGSINVLIPARVGTEPDSQLLSYDINW